MTLKSLKSLLPGLGKFALVLGAGMFIQAVYNILFTGDGATSLGFNIALHIAITGMLFTRMGFVRWWRGGTKTFNEYRSGLDDLFNLAVKEKKMTETAAGELWGCFVRMKAMWNILSKSYEVTGGVVRFSYYAIMMFKLIAALQFASYALMVSAVVSGF